MWMQVYFERTFQPYHSQKHFHKHIYIYIHFYKTWYLHSQEWFHSIFSYILPSTLVSGSIFAIYTSLSWFIYYMFSTAFHTNNFQFLDSSYVLLTKFQQFNTMWHYYVTVPVPWSLEIQSAAVRIWPSKMMTHIPQLLLYIILIESMIPVWLCYSLQLWDNCSNSFCWE